MDIEKIYSTCDKAVENLEEVLAVMKLLRMSPGRVLLDYPRINENEYLIEEAIKLINSTQDDRIPF